MKKLQGFKLLAFICTLAALTLPLKSTAEIIVGVSSDTNPAELSQLTSSLESLGYTVVQDDFTNADIIISTCGHNTSIVAGIPYIQISDYGSSWITDSYLPITNGASVTLTLTGSSSILDGVSSSWTSHGFWYYGTTTYNYIGWATGDDLKLASITYDGTTYTGALAMNETGDQAYIGWSIYGSAATADDLKLLSNLINTMTCAAVPEPSDYASIAGVLVFGGALYCRRKRRV